MKKLVIFMIKLALLGTILAFAWYFAVELPLQQAALHAPSNCWHPTSLWSILSPVPGGTPINYPPC